MEVARKRSEVKENEGKSGKRGGRRDGWKGKGIEGKNERKPGNRCGWRGE